MTSDSGTSASDPDDVEPAWKRRRRLDAVFGDELPDQIVEPGERRDGRGRDWYDANRPPHYE